MHAALEMEDILRLIFAHLEKKELLVRMARVNKHWSSTALNMAWVNIGSGGLRPILKCVPGYTDRGICPLVSGTCDWTRFQMHVATRIHILDLDFTSVSAREYALIQVLKSVSLPATFQLPNLRVLRIDIVPGTADLQLAKCFMADRVTEFAVRVVIPSNITVENDPTALTDLYDTIMTKMPNLEKVSIQVPRRELFAPTLSPCIQMLTKLPRLRSAMLPAYALSLATVTSLAKSATLSQVLAYGSDCRWRVEAIPQAPGLSETAIDFNETTGVLSDITLTECLPLSQEFYRVINSMNPTSLSVIIPRSEKCEYLFVARLFDAIGKNLPGLQKLKVCIFGRMRRQLDYAILRPLRACAHLETLDIEAPMTTHLQEDEFEDLVSHWPNLLHLGLDDGDLRGVDMFIQPLLTLSGVVSILQKHCPLLQSLSVYTSPSTVSAPNTLGTWSSLTDISLRFGHNTSPASLTSPADMARYLYLLCPKECELKMQDIMALDKLAFRPPRQGLLPPPGTEAARAQMARYLDSCRLELLMSRLRDGKQPRKAD